MQRTKVQTHAEAFKRLAVLTPFYIAEFLRRYAKVQQMTYLFVRYLTLPVGTAMGR